MLFSTCKQAKYIYIYMIYFIQKNFVYKRSVKLICVLVDKASFSRHQTALTSDRFCSIWEMITECQTHYIVRKLIIKKALSITLLFQTKVILKWAFSFLFCPQFSPQFLIPAKKFHLNASLIPFQIATLFGICKPSTDSLWTILLSEIIIYSHQLFLTIYLSFIKWLLQMCFYKSNMQDHVSFCGHGPLMTVKEKHCWPMVTSLWLISSVYICSVYIC